MIPTRPTRRAGMLLVLLAVGTTLAGCLEKHSPPTAPPPPIGGNASVPSDRVLVVNTLSETLSSLDPDTGTLTVQAAVAGTWVNRVTTGPDSRRLLLTNSGANEVEILDAIDLSPIVRVDLGPARSPWTAVVVDGARILVTNWLAGTVQLASVTGPLIGSPLATTPGPEGVLVRDGRAFVACTHFRSEGGYGPGRVDVVELASWQVVASIPVGSNPQDLAFAPDGHLHVVCTGTPGDVAGDGTVHVIDPTSNVVTGVVPIGGSPGRIASDGAGVMWTVGYSGGLRSYDAGSLAMFPDPDDPALRGPGLSAVAFDPVRDALYVTHFDGDLLLELAAATGEVQAVWQVGDGPVDVLVHRPRSSGSSPGQRGRSFGQNE